MRDFSFVYGPIKTWLTVLAAAALLTAVVMRYQDDPAADQDCLAGGDCSGRLAFCDEAEDADCTGPTPPEDTVDSGAVQPSVEPVLVEAELPRSDDGAETTDDPWADFERSGSEVPFVSLSPADEGLTDAGQGLIPTTTAPAVESIEPRSATTVDTP